MSSFVNAVSVKFKWLGRIALMSAVLVGALGWSVNPASADNALGELTFNPGNGLDSSPIWAVTSRPCPADAAYLAVYMFGSGLPPEGMMVTGSTKAGMSHTERILSPFQDNLLGLASQYGVVLTGPYRVELRCQDAFGLKVAGTYEGTINFTSPHHYESKGVTLLFPSTDLPGGRPQLPPTPAPSSAVTPSNPGSAATTVPTNGSSAAPSQPAASGVDDPSGAATSSAGGAPATGGEPSAGVATSAADPNAQGQPDSAGVAAPATTGSTNAAASSGLSSQWVLIALGGLLVVLGLLWSLRSRLGSRSAAPARATSPETDVVDSENVSDHLAK